MGLWRKSSSSSIGDNAYRFALSDRVEQLRSKLDALLGASGNPRPNRYTINEIIQYGVKEPAIVVDLIYHDCTNFEGRKILVFKNCSIEQIKRQKLIDPHFSNSKKYHHSFARFEPTKTGIKAANELAYKIAT